MNKKGILKHFFIIGGGTVFSLLLGVITTPIITRIVNPTEYGQYSMFITYGNIAMSVLLLGMDQALVRYYYQSDDGAYKKALLFRCIKWPLSISLVVSAVVIVCSATGWISFEFSTGIMVLLCLYTLFEVIYKISMDVVRLEYNSKLYSALNMFFKFIFAAVAVSLLFLFKKRYSEILCFASTFSVFSVMLISILSHRKMWKVPAWKNACTVSRKEILKYALPLTVSVSIIYLFQALDKLALKYFCTYVEVGIYASAASLVNIFAIIQTTFNTMWSPMAIEHYSKDPADRTFYQKGNQIITVVMFFLGFSLICCKDIFALFLGEKYREAAYILPFLIFHPIMYTISETTVTGINFMKKSKFTILIAGISCLVNLTGNIILVPGLGGRGAAISTGFSYIVFFILRTAISNHYFYVDFKLGKFAVLTVFACVYSFYNTFVKFNLISVVMYIAGIALIFVLYRKTIITELKYLVDIVKNRRNKKAENSCP